MGAFFHMAGRDDHVTAHRMWAFIHEHPEEDLTAAEHQHILQCQACFDLFMLCLKSSTFGAVLKKIKAA
jgi:hypothetical protein